MKVHTYYNSQKSEMSTQLRYYVYEKGNRDTHGI